MTILQPFPQPGEAIVDAFDRLDILARGDQAEMEEAGGLSDLPRPWDPATCADDALRRHIWQWCDQVAAWVNREHAWRPAHLIPPCWPRHPHLARELPVLAALRWTAGNAATPDPLEAWHQYALPGFLHRMAERLGQSGCNTGKHLDWPAAARHTAHTAPAAATDRNDVITADTPHA